MNKHFLTIIAAVCIQFLALGCFTENRPAENVKKDFPDSLLAAKRDSLIKLESRVTYGLFAFSKKNTTAKLLKKIGKDNLDNILAINRIDKLKRDTLVVPDSIYADFNMYAPFPLFIDRIKEVKKIIFVSQRIQAFAAYEYGSLVFWGPVSTGKKTTPTPNGLFHTNWKAKKQISTDDPTWILYWNFNIINNKGVSLHQFELPGYPASHSCVRLLERSANRIYNWADQWVLTADGNSIKYYGTPVILFGEYKTPKIWRFLARDKEVALVGINEIDQQLDEYLNTILQRQKAREINGVTAK